MKTAKSESSKDAIKASEKGVEAATQDAVKSIDEAMKAKEKDVMTV